MHFLEVVSLHRQWLQVIVAGRVYISVVLSGSRMLLPMRRSGSRQKTDKIEEAKPDYLLILPWNFKDEIMNQMSYIRGWGGQFVTPIPEVQVYP